MILNASSLAKNTALLGSAVAIAFLLFLVMKILINSDDILEKVDSERTHLNFVRVDRSDDVKTKKRQPPREPPPPETPPDTPDTSTQITGANSALNNTPNLSMNIPSIGVPLNSGDGPYLGALSQGSGLAGFDTDVIPLVRVSPTYPRNAKTAKIQGFVTMDVTIDPDGTVSKAKVIEAKPPRLFDKAALTAIKRWKFRPKIENGKPVAQRAKQTIEFKLNGSN